MRNEFFNKKSEIIIKQRNVLLILFISSILIIFLQVIVLIKKDTKIILVPNNLSQETVLYSNKILKSVKNFMNLGIFGLLIQT